MTNAFGKLFFPACKKFSEANVLSPYNMTLRNAPNLVYFCLHIFCKQGIKRVELLKRINKIELTVRMRRVELRIGRYDETAVGLAQFKRNPLAGYYAGENAEQRAIFEIPNGASGKYVTFQTVADNASLEINEIYIFN